MDEVACPECLAPLARIAELERRIAQLEARLGTKSTNSSLPPSANPLDAPQPVTKKKSKRCRGGQPGHPPPLKRLLPLDRGDRVVTFRPTHCDRCHVDLPATPTPTDLERPRFQTTEVPPLLSGVTEYQGHACACPAYGEVARAAIPQDIRAPSVGPRLTAILSYFTGCHGVRKRGVEEIAEAAFAAPIALGTVANLEREVSAALATPHAEALEVVRAAVKHADETNWKLCWLWAAATAGIAAFTTHAGRGAAGLTVLLIQGIVCSDRWGAYNRVPQMRRQVCGARLKRDFQKIVDRGGDGARVGKAGQRIIKRDFAAWHAFEDQALTREQRKERLAPVIRRRNGVLLEEYTGTDPTVATFCGNRLELGQAMWTFARVDDVEPTNNHIERLLCRAVLWCKRSFGSQSAAGCRFVERILTVVQTRRLQGKSVLEYLHDALVAKRAGVPCPKLVPEGGTVTNSFYQHLHLSMFIRVHLWLIELRYFPWPT